jgi:hypothetical protein
LLQRNDVTDIITISGAATIFICLRQGLLQRNDVADIITISRAATIFICLFGIATSYYG